MGMFAFRRLREREAASTEVASVPAQEPLTLTPEDQTDRRSNRRNARGRQRQFISDVE